MKTKTKKNLHLITAIYASKAQHSYEYVRNFCSNLNFEYEITLHLACKKNKSIKIPANININYTNISYSRTDVENFIKYRYFGKYFRALTKQYLCFLYYRKIAKSNIIKRGDLVYVMDYDVIPLPYLVNKLSKINVRIFLWIHSAKFKSKDFVYSLYKLFFKKIFHKLIIKNLSGIIVNGRFIKLSLIKSLGIKESFVHIIQYPSEINFTERSKKEARDSLKIKYEDKVILFFGGLREDKNIEKLIQSVSLAKVKAKLIIAGSEGFITKLNITEWIKKYNLTNYILDINFISEDKIALYYQASDLLMLTYNEESASQSGPLSLARYFTLPALVSDVGEIGMYVKNNCLGLVADPQMELGFSEQIDYFFNLNQSSLDKIKDNIIDAKQNFSWMKAAEKYKSIFS